MPCPKGHARDDPWPKVIKPMIIMRSVLTSTAGVVFLLSTLLTLPGAGAVGMPPVMSISAVVDSDSWAGSFNTIQECLLNASSTAFPPSPAYTKALHLQHNTDAAATAHPLAFTFPNSSEECGRVVRCARRFHVPVVARSGGHSYEAYSLVDGGIVVDLSHMTEVTVDATTESAVIGAGNWLGRIYWKLQAAGGWGLPGGTCASVGIGGHALGGGYGFISRRFGLVSDAILALTLVDGDGSVRRVDSETDADLFWALRGAGGGHFGIVTEFRFRIFKLPAKMAQGQYFWPAGVDRPAVVRAFIALAPLMPNELTAELFTCLWVGATSVTIVRTGPLAGFEELVSEFLAHFPINFTTDYREFDSFNDLLFNDQNRPEYLLHREKMWYAERFKATSVVIEGALSPSGIDALLHSPGETDLSLASGSWIQVHAFGGAIADVPANATCFPLRSKAMSVVQMYAFWTDEQEGPARRAMVRQWRANVAPFVTPLAYINYIDRELPLEAYYGHQGMARLVKIKGWVGLHGVSHGGGSGRAFQSGASNAMVEGAE